MRSSPCRFPRRAPLKRALNVSLWVIFDKEVEAQIDDSSDARDANRPNEEEGPLDIVDNQHDCDESEREGYSGKDVC